DHKMRFGVSCGSGYALQIFKMQGARTPAFHLLKIVEAFYVPHKQQNFQGFYISSCRDHIYRYRYARRPAIPEFVQNRFRVFFYFVSYLFAEVVAFAKLFPYDLDDIVCMAVGLRKYQSFGHFKLSVFIVSVRKYGGEAFLEGTDNVADLAGVYHVSVKRVGMVNHVFVEAVPAFPPR